MLAAPALMNATAQASRLELRLGSGRAIRAVRVYVRRRVGLIQKLIEFPAVMHARVGHLASKNPSCPIVLTSANPVRQSDSHKFAGAAIFRGALKNKLRPTNLKSPTLPRGGLRFSSIELQSRRTGQRRRAT